MEHVYCMQRRARTVCVCVLRSQTDFLRSVGLSQHATQIPKTGKQVIPGAGLGPLPVRRTDTLRPTFPLPAVASAPVATFWFMRWPGGQIKKTIIQFKFHIGVLQIMLILIL
eukprot:4044862-Pleurochrysis_carterae.AAC.5